MIDISKARYEFSKAEEGFIKYLNEHEFEGSVEKQYVNKTVFIISRDGVTDRYELQRETNVATPYLEWFEGYWDLKCETHELRKREQGN